MKSRVAWLVPAPIKGSGGIREIYNKAQYLCDHGHDCHVFVEGNYDSYELADLVESFYGPRDCVVHSGWDYARGDFDLIFATVWNSAREVARAPASARKAYLVQDFEAWFHPMSEGFVRSEESYGLGLQSICLGRWLPNLLHETSGVTPLHFDFCCEPELYHQTASWDRRELAVCMIHQPDKPRRCSEIGLDALEMLKRDLPEVTLYLFGSTEKARINCLHVNLGILNQREINELYNRCRLGLCISSSNPSRIPFEMMAAGLPVVDIHRVNNLYDFPDDGMLLADPNPVAISRALKSLLQEPARLRKMSEFGRRWMAERPMEKEYEQFYAGVQAIVAGNIAAPQLPARSYRRAAIKAF